MRHSALLCFCLLLFGVTSSSVFAQAPPTPLSTIEIESNETTEGCFALHEDLMINILVGELYEEGEDVYQNADCYSFTLALKFDPEYFVENETSPGADFWNGYSFSLQFSTDEEPNDHVDIWMDPVSDDIYDVTNVTDQYFTFSNESLSGWIDMWGEDTFDEDAGEYIVRFPIDIWAVSDEADAHQLNMEIRDGDGGAESTELHKSPLVIIANQITSPLSFDSTILELTVSELIPTTTVAFGMEFTNEDPATWKGVKELKFTYNTFEQTVSGLYEAPGQMGFILDVAETDDDLQVWVDIKDLGEEGSVLVDGEEVKAINLLESDDSASAFAIFSVLDQYDPEYSGELDLSLYVVSRQAGSYEVSFTPAVFPWPEEPECECETDLDVINSLLSRLNHNLTFLVSEAPVSEAKEPKAPSRRVSGWAPGHGPNTSKDSTSDLIFEFNGKTYNWFELDLEERESLLNQIRIYLIKLITDLLSELQAQTTS